MTVNITWEAVTGLLLIASAVSAVWYRLHMRLNACDREIAALKLEGVQLINALELKISKEYASNEYIAAVEKRLTIAINKVGEKLDRFPPVPPSRRSG